eukprot:Em0007g674a
MGVFDNVSPGRSSSTLNGVSHNVSNPELDLATKHNAEPDSSCLLVKKPVPHPPFPKVQSLKDEDDTLFKISLQRQIQNVPLPLVNLIKQLEQQLRDAARDGRTVELTRLLDQGINIEATDEDGRTPLGFAAGFGHVDCVKVLLDRGANIDHQTKVGRTSLMYASGIGNAECVKVLLDGGAQNNLKEEGYRGPASRNPMLKLDIQAMHLLSDCTSFCSTMELEMKEIIPEYYDILIIGRTGWGKKTLLDKLVGADDGTLRRDWLEQTNDDACKQSFRIVSNKQSIRVTIAPGFGNFSNDKEVNGVCDRNVGSVRLIFKLQRELKISFKRVVYFLPFRGPPGRADSYLKDELKCLWNFYGERIFRCMVMIATNSPDEAYQEIGFSESFERKSKSVVEHVLSEVSGVHSITCPPIAYLSLSCTSEKALDIVQNCAITDEKPLVPSDAKRCVKCASPIIDGFKCHPKFFYILPGDSMVRVLFHISISRISIYTKRAISAQLAMFHVMEFYLWPNLARRNILKNEK